jgi:2-dehydro-3-deoxy-D-arabinonate dehydratase
MRYFRLPESNGAGRLVARDGETAYDLTAESPELTRLVDLLRAASVADVSIDTLAGRYVETAPTVSLDTVETDAGLPVVPPEVWAAGVTYQISEEAREAESGMPEVYLDVYESARPELFLKATPSRTVGPEEPIGIRGDSSWDVPEPELGLVLYRGDIVGYTVGNDVSSRAIEGDNPLYLPQAKVYDRSCALGPCVTAAESLPDASALDIHMEIHRDDAVAFEGTATTAEMARSYEELVEYLSRHNPLPEVCVLLTGTSLVPDESFTLAPGDEVRISIEGIGTLVNVVTTV